MKTNEFVRNQCFYVFFRVRRIRFSNLLPRHFQSPRFARTFNGRCKCVTSDFLDRLFGLLVQEYLLTRMRREVPAEGTPSHPDPHPRTRRRRMDLGSEFAFRSDGRLFPGSPFRRRESKLLMKTY